MAFETINPSAYVTFTYADPSSSPSSPPLRVAVLDSPLDLTSDPPPSVAALFVPQHRHSDWIFSTFSGHLQLLLSFSSPSSFSRLILVGVSPPESPPPTTYRRALFDEAENEALKARLRPLFLALCPKSYFKRRGWVPDVPVLSYEDNVVAGSILEVCDGDFVGQMLVEDVEVESSSSRREFRRRLRFKRMPNLVQTEVRIVPRTQVGPDCVGIGEVEFRIDASVLVHAYLVPMVAALSLAATHIEGRVRPTALCLGVGGGALLGFLSTQLGFRVVGVEADEEVLRVSRKHFGLEDDGENVSVHVGDAFRFIDKLAGDVDSGECGVDSKFDVIMVDLDSSDARDGLSAPPLEFVSKAVLSSLRTILADHGILVVNVIPPDTSFYEALIHKFRNVFDELYEIDIGNGENFILIAAASPLTPSTVGENRFLNRLGKAISEEYLSSIKKI